MSRFLWLTTAQNAYSCASPVTSRRTSPRARLSVYDWSSWKATAAATRPEATTPTRKRAGSRKRRERNIAPPLKLRGRRRLPGGRDLVAHAPDGHDGRGIAELPAQLAHMHVNRTSVPREGVTPHPLEELVAREHEPAVVEQLPEQVELLRCELDFLVADAHLAAAGR